MITSLRYNEDIYDFLPLSDKQQKAITLYQDISGGKRVVAMFRMKDDKLVNTDRLAEAVDTFAQQIQAHDGRRHVKDLTTQIDFEKYAGITEFVYQNLPLMLSDSDYVRMEHILENPNYVEETLANDVQMIMMPATGFFANNIGNDPLELFTPVMQRLQQRQQSLPFDVDDGSADVRCTADFDRRFRRSHAVVHDPDHVSEQAPLLEELRHGRRPVRDPADNYGNPEPHRIPFYSVKRSRAIRKGGNHERQKIE